MNAFYRQVTEEHIAKATGFRGGAKSDVKVVQNPTMQETETIRSETQTETELLVMCEITTEGTIGSETLQRDKNGRYWIRTSDFHRVRMAL